MSEPIRWGELSPEQRDILIHEKVMGVSLICRAKLEIRQGKGFFFWNCWECGLFGIGDDAPTTDEHPRQMDIPLYTTGLDTAWQVVERFGAAELRKWPNVRRYEKMPYSCSITTHGETFSEWGATPQEAICKAALRSRGIKIEE